MRSFYLALTLAYSVALSNAVPRARLVEDTATEPSFVGGVRIPHRKCSPSPREHADTNLYDFSDKRQIIHGPEGYSFNVLEHLAGISPYFDSPGVHLDPSPPEGCHVSKATYLIRHSNIYANDVSPYIIDTCISDLT